MTDVSLENVVRYIQIESGEPNRPLRRELIGDLATVGMPYGLLPDVFLTLLVSPVR